MYDFYLTSNVQNYVECLSANEAIEYKSSILILFDCILFHSLSSLGMSSKLSEESYYLNN